ncbi:hypothetical protein JXA80_13445 [bacterium]|nr:hypothetical protein [candidate division CSSED10-310 bacterium]
MIIRNLSMLCLLGLSCSFLLCSGCMIHHAVKPSVTSGRVSVHVHMDGRTMASSGVLYVIENREALVVLIDPIGRNTGWVSITSSDFQVALMNRRCLSEVKNWPGKVAMVLEDRLTIGDVLAWLNPSVWPDHSVTYRYGTEGDLPLEIRLNPRRADFRDECIISCRDPSVRIRLTWASTPVSIQVEPMRPRVDPEWKNCAGLFDQLE